MVSLLDGCSEGCGWVAAILCALSWGTFGVPIKAAGSSSKQDVHFFVLQSYKTIVCFLTSWLVVFLGEPIRWTPWGIVSGLFWVPGASLGIYAIRNCGVAIAIGTWASIQVCSSFIFGILVFEEQVKNKTHAMIAFGVLMVGLIGMSIYSSEDTSTASIPPSPHKASSSFSRSDRDYNKRNSDKGFLKCPSTVKRKAGIGPFGNSPSGGRSESFGTPNNAAHSSEKASTSLVPLEVEDGDNVDLQAPLLPGKEGFDASSQDGLYNKAGKDRQLKVFFGGRVALTKRQLGILGAIVNGAWGGLNLIPLHYAQRDEGLSGASYVISYASGSMLVCVAIWICMLLYHCIFQRLSLTESWEQLPAWNIRELGLPGCAAGLLYSIGNFCSILAVAYLGQGVGFSFCQAQLLISGLWGVFYFEEIQGKDSITKWFISAGVTITGIILLSYQHKGGASH